MSTTAIPGDVPLRRRLRVLERAQSLSSAATPELPKILEMKHKAGPEEEQAPSTPTDYESHSDSSDDENTGEAVLGEEEYGVPEEGSQEAEAEAEERMRHRRPSLDTHGIRRSSTKESPMSPTTRAWYEFDLAVVVALVSPIGNWLTGGDHVKNILLIVLLIFYLHQVIEVPWALYQKSRPRHRAFHMPPIDPNSPEGHYAKLAASELQKFELFFLFLTFLSPLIGATLLRYVTAAILGSDAVSWFSTGLFVLATAVRPWAHLVDRLGQRTTELHDFVHYPSPARTASEDEHKLLEQRVLELEKSLNKLKTKFTHTTEDVYEYVDDTIDAIEHAMKKQGRKFDKCEERVDEVSHAVGELRTTITSDDNAQKNHSRHLLPDVGFASAYMHSVLDHVVPTWLVSSPPSSPLPGHKNLYSNTTSTASTRVAMRPLAVSGTGSPTSPVSTPLETIVEEELDYPYETDSRDKLPLLARPYSFTSALVHRAVNLAIMPLRAVARMVLRNY